MSPCAKVEHDHDDNRLCWELAHGNGTALEPLMERWGDPIAETCFRALRDAERALDLYAEVCAEAYGRLRFGTRPLPESFGPWAVEIIGDVLKTAAEEGQIPTRARVRMNLPPAGITQADLVRLESLRDPPALRAAREALPRDFSAAADRMLLRVPEPSALSRIRPSSPRGDP
jgi:DNA-directed RNA polymerase specialized sigma24 family protein